MHKQDLIDQIAQKTQATKKATDAFLTAFTEVVQEAVAKGEKIALIGFGTFEAVQTAAREGRNPATGAPLKIAASIRPKFTPGAQFRALVKAKVQTDTSAKKSQTNKAKAKPAVQKKKK